MLLFSFSIYMEFIFKVIWLWGYCSLTIIVYFKSNILISAAFCHHKAVSVLWEIDQDDKMECQLNELESTRLNSSSFLYPVGP